MFGLAVNLNVYEEMSLKVVFILKFSEVHYLFIQGKDES